MFWTGYGAYLSPSEESATKTILKYRGNEKRATSTHLAVENVFGIRLGKSRKQKELPDFIWNQIALFLRIMKFCCQIVATRGIKAQKVQCLRAFLTSEIIPTRQVKTRSKLFCIDRLIPFGFIWYQLSQSYGVSDFLLSKSYRGMLSTTVSDKVI